MPSRCNAGTTDRRMKGEKERESKREREGVRVQKFERKGQLPPDTTMYSANTVCLDSVTPFVFGHVPKSFLPQLPSSPLTRTPSRTMHLSAAHWTLAIYSSD